jgi:hypothetical protein
MRYDGLVKSPSAALRGNFGKGAGGWVQERTLFLVFFYTLPPICYPLFRFLRALHIFSVGFMIFMRSSRR